MPGDKQSSPIVTLCGSMRFWDDFTRIGAILTEQGYMVMTPFKKSDDLELSKSELEAQSKYLMEMQKRRIDFSDKIFVINKGGYIGESTKEEIEYATKKGNIDIIYLEPIKRKPVVTLIGSSKFMNTFQQVEKSLSQRGLVVLTPAIFKHPGFQNGQVELTPAQHKMYDELHQQKMLMSDYVVLITENNYIGNNTQEELDFCRLRGIEVKHYEEVLMYAEP